MIALGLLLAALIGMLLGLLGGGGSILAVPVFAYVLDLDPKLAIAASFGVVGISSLFAAFSHHCNGNVDVRTGLLFALGSAVVSFAAGAWLSRLLDGTTQMVIFAIVMGLAAVFMFRGRREGRHLRHAHADAPGARRFTPRALAAFLLMGVLVGVVTGVAGVGGGFMIVPVLLLFGGIPMQRAVGTSLLVIAINSFAALGGYLAQPAIREALASTSVGGLALIPFLGVFVLMTMAGAEVGARIGASVPARTLRLAFASFLVVMSAYIVVRTLA